MSREQREHHAKRTATDKVYASVFGEIENPFCVHGVFKELLCPACALPVVMDALRETQQEVGG